MGGYKCQITGDKISCPARQLDGGCIETAVDSNFMPWQQFTRQNRPPCSSHDIR